MHRCFELAEDAGRRGDTAVGSLLADENGKIIAEAGEQNRTIGLFAHAELMVIQQAINDLQTNDLTGLVLYTTNEPCFLCSFAIRQTRVSRIVFCRVTQGIGGVTSKYPILSANDIKNWKAPPEIIKLDEK